ncbi:hypothetical protein ACFCYN_18725 [Gottfriedia sp. NPDC056225]|uniref:hypothetical protein n=1 Tax=Gottfriedia sp. NPDC056225 TaxID=3345751 RepID=UPI0035E2E792
MMYILCHSFIILRLHTLADRSDANRAFDIIPRSIESLAEYLGMSKSTLYRQLQPLWEFGLIDIIEYEESTRKAQKPKNIIVYEYPQNIRNRTSTYRIKSQTVELNRIRNKTQ